MNQSIREALLCREATGLSPHPLLINRRRPKQDTVDFKNLVFPQVSLQTASLFMWEQHQIDRCYLALIAWMTSSQALLTFDSE